LIKCTLIVPVTYNDGTPVSTRKLKGYCYTVTELSGGCTISKTLGLFCMADGEYKSERGVAFSIVCNLDRLQKLRDFAWRIACELNQESVYLDWQDINVEFVTQNKREA